MTHMITLLKLGSVGLQFSLQQKIVNFQVAMVTVEVAGGGGWLKQVKVLL